ncbi:hypothetical protein Kfla_5019 [Kribbella flavida DSM 17836]|uniref:Uncharacterized protein n=1 Tax=Kribbella flavida (strain DSM 17836 / JCM 10339 / NBRC 14399) TaxID=479435 RepID=D2Q3B2_KRIFD|nr:hypothetical protein [Kribbella flavida]ADB34035.1 hypothetical protein Kfla_5019 [Kribbella flavida DSM 17836]
MTWIKLFGPDHRKPRAVDGLPVLSVGSHRTADHGACFMEYASYLAGAPWSDHPDCTHPLLALVAREVNDETSAAGRPLLAPLIPSVIGTAATDLRIAPALVARCLPLVAPHVSAQYARILVAAVEQADRTLAALRDDEAAGVTGDGTGVAAYETTAALALAGSVRAVTDFRHPHPDPLLRRLLVEAIAVCRSFPSVPAGDRPTAAEVSRAASAC